MQNNSIWSISDQIEQINPNEQIQSICLNLAYVSVHTLKRAAFHVPQAMKSASGDYEEP